MAKQLILVRHGKAENQLPDGSDFDRKLTNRGRHDATEMAARLSARALKPAYHFSSSAPRALETAEIFSDVWGFDPQTITKDISVYEASVKALLKAINKFPDKADTAVMFGHNPGIAQLAMILTAEDIYDVPTAGVVVINFEADSWAEISGNTGTMLLFDYPELPFSPPQV